MTKNIKKAVALALCFLILLASVGCGNLNNGPQASTTAENTTASPETEAPETVAPETVAPETEAPETEAPETVVPETEAPGTEAPETVVPETVVPETVSPETEAPETEAPETVAPGTEAPETVVPETEAPETEAPETPDLTEDGRYTFSLNAGTVALTVDGIKDDAYVNGLTFEAEHNLVDSENTFTLYMMADTEYVYVIYVIKDSEIINNGPEYASYWHNDCADFLLNTSAEAKGGNEFRIFGNIEGGKGTANAVGVPESVTDYFVKRTDDGYNVEFKIDRAALADANVFSFMAMSTNATAADTRVYSCIDNAAGAGGDAAKAMLNEISIVDMEVTAPSYNTEAGNYVYEITRSETDMVVDGLFDPSYIDGVFLTATHNLPESGSYFNVYFKADGSHLYVFYEVIKKEQIFYSEDYVKNVGSGHHLDCANLVLDVAGREEFNNNEMHILAGIEGGRGTAVVKNDPAAFTRADNWYVRHTERGYNVEISYALKTITGADANGDKMVSFLAIATITTGWPNKDQAPERKYPFVTNAGGETVVNTAKESPSFIVIKDTASYVEEPEPPRPGANYSVPSELQCGPWANSGHIQGMAIDDINGYVYYSFAGNLIKADFEGNLVASVNGIQGHLGCVSYDPDRNRLYGSLELKGNNTFYLVSFDCDKLVREDMKVDDEGVMKVVKLTEVSNDYGGTDEVSGKAHRYGCSGIDGVAYGPGFGRRDRETKKIMVAYGIFGDTSRTDNDYQVILQYDPSIVDEYGATLDYSNLPTSGPEDYERKLFFYTGNTSYGIQNLEYDAYHDVYILAVYVGSKTTFTNFNMFFIDANSSLTMQPLIGRDGEHGIVLEAADLGVEGLNGIRGSRFAYGSMGTCSLGNGIVYFSTTSNGKVIRYRWSETDPNLFEPAW